MAGARIHDTNLIGLEVSDEGQTLILRLEARDKDRSLVQFKSVAAYSIAQTGGAIITEIREETLDDLRAYGGDTLQSLEHIGHVVTSESTKVWVLESAIGFLGYVIGETIETTAI